MRARTHVVVALVAAAACAPGCKQEPPARVPPVWPGPAECRLGSGVLAFTPIEEGDALLIVRGGQGGYHVWGSVLARYMEPERAQLKFELSYLDDGKPVSPTFDLSLKANLDPFAPSLYGPQNRVAAWNAIGTWQEACTTGEPHDAGAAPDGWTGRDAGAAPDGSGWSMYLGHTVFVAKPCEAHARTLRMRVTITDLDGRTCSDEKTFVAYCTTSCRARGGDDAGVGGT